MVDTEDHATWIADMGESVVPGAGADGNGDGVVDAADYVMWRKLYEAQLLGSGNTESLNGVLSAPIATGESGSNDLPTNIQAEAFTTQLAGPTSSADAVDIAVSHGDRLARRYSEFASRSSIFDFPSVKSIGRQNRRDPSRTVDADNQLLVAAIRTAIVRATAIDQAIRHFDSEPCQKDSFVELAASDSEETDDVFTGLAKPLNVRKSMLDRL